MAFTDAQLKYLKENYEGLNDNSGCVLVKPDMEDLLARLKAAENVASYVSESLCPTALMEAWRKSKGQQ